MDNILTPDWMGGATPHEISIGRENPSLSPIGLGPPLTPPEYIFWNTETKKLEKTRDADKWSSVVFNVGDTISRDWTNKTLTEQGILFNPLIQGGRMELLRDPIERALSYYGADDPTKQKMREYLNLDDPQGMTILDSLTRIVTKLTSSNPDQHGENMGALGAPLAWLMGVSSDPFILDSAKDRDLPDWIKTVKDKKADDIVPGIYTGDKNEDGTYRQVPVDTIAGEARNARLIRAANTNDPDFNPQKAWDQLDPIVREVLEGRGYSKETFLTDKAMAPNALSYFVKAQTVATIATIMSEEEALRQGTGYTSYIFKYGAPSVVINRLILDYDNLATMFIPLGNVARGTEAAAGSSVFRKLLNRVGLSTLIDTPLGYVDEAVTAFQKLNNASYRIPGATAVGLDTALGRSSWAGAAFMGTASPLLTQSNEDLKYMHAIEPSELEDYSLTGNLFLHSAMGAVMTGGFHAMFNDVPELFAKGYLKYLPASARSYVRSIKGVGEAIGAWEFRHMVDEAIKSAGGDPRFGMMYENLTQAQKAIMLVRHEDAKQFIRNTLETGWGNVPEAVAKFMGEFVTPSTLAAHGLDVIDVADSLARLARLPIEARPNYEGLSEFMRGLLLLGKSEVDKGGLTPEQWLAKRAVEIQDEFSLLSAEHRFNEAKDLTEGERNAAMSKLAKAQRLREKAAEAAKDPNTKKNLGAMEGDADSAEKEGAIALLRSHNVKDLQTGVDILKRVLVRETKAGVEVPKDLVKRIKEIDHIIERKLAPTDQERKILDLEALAHEVSKGKGVRWADLPEGRTPPKGITSLSQVVDRLAQYRAELRTLVIEPGKDNKVSPELTKAHRARVEKKYKPVLDFLSTLDTKPDGTIDLSKLFIYRDRMNPRGLLEEFQRAALKSDPGADPLESEFGGAIEFLTELENYQGAYSKLKSSLRKIDADKSLSTGDAETARLKAFREFEENSTGYMTKYVNSAQEVERAARLKAFEELSTTDWRMLHPESQKAIISEMMDYLTHLGARPGQEWLEARIEHLNKTPIGTRFKEMLQNLATWPQALRNSFLSHYAIVRGMSVLHDPSFSFGNTFSMLSNPFSLRAATHSAIADSLVVIRQGRRIRERYGEEGKVLLNAHLIERRQAVPRNERFTAEALPQSIKDMAAKMNLPIEEVLKDIRAWDDSVTDYFVAAYASGLDAGMMSGGIDPTRYVSHRLPEGMDPVAVERFVDKAVRLRLAQYHDTTELDLNTLMGLGYIDRKADGSFVIPYGSPFELVGATETERLEVVKKIIAGGRQAFQDFYDESVQVAKRSKSEELRGAASLVDHVYLGEEYFPGADAALDWNTHKDDFLYTLQYGSDRDLITSWWRLNDDSFTNMSLSESKQALALINQEILSRTKAHTSLSVSLPSTFSLSLIQDPAEFAAISPLHDHIQRMWERTSVTRIAGELNHNLTDLQAQFLRRALLEVPADSLNVYIHHYLGSGRWFMGSADPLSPFKFVIASFGKSFDPTTFLHELGHVVSYGRYSMLRQIASSAFTMLSFSERSALLAIYGLPQDQIAYAASDPDEFIATWLQAIWEDRAAIVNETFNNAAAHGETRLSMNKAELFWLQGRQIRDLMEAHLRSKLPWLTENQAEVTADVGSTLLEISQDLGTTNRAYLNSMWYEMIQKYANRTKSEQKIQPTLDQLKVIQDITGFSPDKAKALWTDVWENRWEYREDARFDIADQYGLYKDVFDSILSGMIDLNKSRLRRGQELIWTPEQDASFLVDANPTHAWDTLSGNVRQSPEEETAAAATVDYSFEALTKRHPELLTDFTNLLVDTLNKLGRKRNAEDMAQEALIQWMTGKINIDPSRFSSDADAIKKIGGLLVDRAISKDIKQSIKDSNPIRLVDQIQKNRGLVTDVAPELALSSDMDTGVHSSGVLRQLMVEHAEATKPKGFDLPITLDSNKQVNLQGSFFVPGISEEDLASYFKARYLERRGEEPSGEQIIKGVNKIKESWTSRLWDRTQQMKMELQGIDPAIIAKPVIELEQTASVVSDTAKFDPSVPVSTKMPDGATIKVRSGSPKKPVTPPPLDISPEAQAVLADSPTATQAITDALKAGDVDGAAAVVGKAEAVAEAADKSTVDAARGLIDKITSHEPRTDLPYQDFTEANLVDAFGIEPEQAAATVALAEAMGLDTSLIRVVKGGTPGESALFEMAWHGTWNAQIRKFDMEFVGAGEGTQHEGWGMYFTSSENEGKWYGQHISSIHEERGKSPPLGGLYRVELNLDRNVNVLDRNLPINEQPTVIQQKLEKLIQAEGLIDWFSIYSDWRTRLGREIYDDLSSLFASRERKATGVSRGRDHAETQRQASQLLKKYGINAVSYQDPGISTLTGASVARLPTNYVVFDPADIMITGRWVGSQHERAPLLQGAKGSVEFLADGTALIRALKSPDASTGIHEIAHIARRRLLDRGVSQDRRIGISDADITTVEQWAGATDGTWTVEAEEKFARGFERYLREGKAPDPRLENVFTRFAAWLKKIYTVLSRGPLKDAQLTPEVRQVLDRLVTRNLPEIKPPTPEARALDSVAVPYGKRSLVFEDPVHKAAFLVQRNKGKADNPLVKAANEFLDTNGVTDKETLGRTVVSHVHRQLREKPEDMTLRIGKDAGTAPPEPPKPPAPPGDGGGEWPEGWNRERWRRATNFWKGNRGILKRVVDKRTAAPAVPEAWLSKDPVALYDQALTDPSVYTKEWKDKNGERTGLQVAFSDMVGKHQGRRRVGTNAASMQDVRDEVRRLGRPDALADEDRVFQLIDFTSPEGQALSREFGTAMDIDKSVLNYARFTGTRVGSMLALRSLFEGATGGKGEYAQPGFGGHGLSWGDLYDQYELSLRAMLERDKDGNLRTPSPEEYKAIEHAVDQMREKYLRAIGRQPGQDMDSTFNTAAQLGKNLTLAMLGPGATMSMGFVEVPMSILRTLGLDPKDSVALGITLMKDLVNGTFGRLMGKKGVSEFLEDLVFYAESLEASPLGRISGMTEPIADAGGRVNYTIAERTRANWQTLKAIWANTPEGPGSGYVPKIMKSMVSGTGMLAQLGTDLAGMRLLTDASRALGSRQARREILRFLPNLKAMRDAMIDRYGGDINWKIPAKEHKSTIKGLLREFGLEYNVWNRAQRSGLMEDGVLEAIQDLLPEATFGRDASKANVLDLNTMRERAHALDYQDRTRSLGMTQVHGPGARRKALVGLHQYIEEGAAGYSPELRGLFKLDRNDQLTPWKRLMMFFVSYPMAFFNTAIQANFRNRRLVTALGNVAGLYTLEVLSRMARDVLLAPTDEKRNEALKRWSDFAELDPTDVTSAAMRGTTLVPLMGASHWLLSELALPLSDLMLPKEARVRRFGKQFGASPVLSTGSRVWKTLVADPLKSLARSKDTGSMQPTIDALGNTGKLALDLVPGVNVWGKAARNAWETIVSKDALDGGDLSMPPQVKAWVDEYKLHRASQEAQQGTHRELPPPIQAPASAGAPSKPIGLAPEAPKAPAPSDRSKGVAAILEPQKPTSLDILTGLRGPKRS